MPQGVTFIDDGTSHHKSLRVTSTTPHESSYDTQRIAYSPVIQYYDNAFLSPRQRTLRYVARYWKDCIGARTTSRVDIRLTTQWPLNRLLVGYTVFRIVKTTFKRQSRVIDVQFGTSTEVYAYRSLAHIYSIDKVIHSGSLSYAKERKNC